MSVPTDSQINAAIAEACGWKHEWLHGGKQALPDSGQFEDSLVWKPPGGGWLESVPNYTSDLNAMAQARATLSKDQHAFYVQNLAAVCGIDEGVEWTTDEDWILLDATARQQAEAFLKTVGKWPKEDRDP